MPGPDDLNNINNINKEAEGYDEDEFNNSNIMEDGDEIGEENPNIINEEPNVVNGNLNNINENPNIINEEPEGNNGEIEGGEVDLNDSYIDEDEFGYQINPNQYKFEINEATREEIEKLNHVNNRQEGPAAEPQLQQPVVQVKLAFEVPSIMDTIDTLPGVVPSRRSYYDMMWRGLGEVLARFNFDYDTWRYLVSLEVLAKGANSLERAFEIDGVTQNVTITAEEAWNTVHGVDAEGVSNYDKILAKPFDETRTVRQEMVRIANTRPSYAPYYTESEKFIRSRTGQAFPGVESIREPDMPPYVGNDVFASAADFAAKIGNPDYDPSEKTMTREQIDDRMAAIAAPYMQQNGGNFNINMLNEADREEYEYLSGVAKYYDAYVESNTLGKGFLEEHTTIYDFRKNLSSGAHGDVISRNIRNDEFRNANKAMTKFVQRANLGVSAREVQKHTQDLLASRQVSRATSGLNGLIRSVANGDMTKLDDLIVRNDGYASLLGLNHFYDVINSELDLKGKGVDPEMPIAEIIAILSGDEDFQRVCDAHAEDPLFRKGVLAVGNISKNADNIGNIVYSVSEEVNEIDSRMSRVIFNKTLAPMNAEKIKNLNDSLGLEGDTGKLADAVQSSMKKQAVLAKMLFLANLGYKENGYENEDGELEVDTFSGNAMDMMSHGGYLRFNLARGGREEKLALHRTIHGTVDEGYVYRPTFSSMYVTTSAYGEDGSRSVHGGIHSQTVAGGTYKVDIGIGGAGNIGPDGKVINDSGSNGVINMRGGIGDENEASVIAVNIEPNKYGEKGPLGSSNDTRYSDKNLSAFMSNKKVAKDEYGIEVSLAHIDAANLTNLVKRFDKYYSDLQKQAITDPEKAKELTDVNMMLTGEALSDEEMQIFMHNKLGLSIRDANRTVVLARKSSTEPTPPDMEINIDPPEDPHADMDEDEIKADLQNERNKFEALIFDKLEETIGVIKEVDKDGIGEDEIFFDDLDEQDQAIDNSLENYLKTSAERLPRLSKKEQDVLACKMVDAIYKSGGDPSYTVDPDKLDPKRIMRAPSIAYQLKYDRENFMNNLASAKIDTIMKGTNDMHEMLTGTEQKDRQSINSLRELYGIMNVPNLAKRTPEYQKMVKVIGQVSSKEKISPEDKVRVINAVRHYASKKSVVPNSDSGKKSLNFGYMAIKAVTASDSAQNKFMGPLERNITRLQNAMVRDRLIDEDMRIKLPQQAANHNIVNEVPQNQMNVI